MADLDFQPGSFMPPVVAISMLMGLTSTYSSKSLSLNWLSYHLLQPYSIKVTVGVTEQW